MSLLSKKLKEYYKRFIVIAEKRPIAVFILLLGLLLGLIIFSNIINRPKPTEKDVTLPTKEVKVYAIGTSPKITVQAQVEKSGITKVVALSQGVVQSISVEVGQEVNQGQNLVSLSTNYQGGNAFSVQRQLAQVQYKNVLDTFQINKELIDKQKEIAEKTDKNADELRKITSDSLGASRSLIDLNKNILSTLEAQQKELEATNVGRANDSAILQTKQLRSQLMTGNNQLEFALKNSEYSAWDTNPPAEISDISKEITLKQLEIQEKALNLNKEISRLSMIIAQINEAIMYPSAPVGGVVERIYVRLGQAVNPGTPLVQISGNNSNLIAVAILSRELSQAVSQAQVSTLHLGKESYDEVPFYVSGEATDGSFYTAEFQIPQEFSSQVTDKGYILIDIPVDFPKTGSTVPFVPIDSVYQTQDQAYMFVASRGKAKSRKVILGQVIGRFVEVKEGLREQDQVILNRNVISNDPVKIVK